MEIVKAISCGSCKAYCCRVIGKILPELDRGDCACIHLTDDNKCSIYNNRPFICDTVKIYEKYFSNKYTIEQWNEMNQIACKELQNEAEQSEMEDKVQKF